MRTLLTCILTFEHHGMTILVLEQGSHRQTAKMPASERTKNAPVMAMIKLHNQRGQALAETGIVLVVFILLVGGVMQFGHAFMVANMITHAARDGARLAASWQSRGTCGLLQNTDPITNATTGAVAARIATVSAETFTVTVTQDPPVAAAPPCSPATTPTVTVNVQGCVPYIFNFLKLGNCTGSGGELGFQVNRSVTFDDEGRTFG
jgi:Flp pilus assembly protein TadG